MKKFIPRRKKAGNRSFGAAAALLFLAATILPTALSARESVLSSETLSRIDAAVEKQIDGQDLVGVGIGILQGGKVVYTNGYGFANREEKIPFTNSTVVNWASNSKPFLAVAALQLVDRGKLKLEASVREYLPELPDEYSNITIRHLLCHQSGFPHYSNGTIEPLPGNSFRDLELQDPLHSLRRFAGSPLLSRPGETYRYSSYAYILLSAAVQRAGEQALVEQLEQRIAKPLGLASFQLDHTFRGQANWATGYNRKKGSSVEPVEDYAHYWKHGAGAYKSNIVDFAKWAEALMEGRLMSRESTRAMWTPEKTSSGKPTDAGLGVFVTIQNGTLKVSHNGSHSEAKSRMVLYPARKSGMVVFSNCGHADPGKISTAVYRAMTQ